MVVTVATVKVAGLVGALAVVPVADRDNGPGLEGVAMRRGGHQDYLSRVGCSNHAKRGWVASIM